MIKEAANLLTPYLMCIFKAVFQLGTYSEKWHSWDTIVLRKPGKPRYDMPKAYRPIALTNTMGKLLSAIVAQDISYMCKRYQLLPDTHFGGCPGRNTSDAMNYLTNRCYEAAALLPRGSGFGVWGSVWNFADTKRGEGSWTLASVHAPRLPSVTVQIFQM